MLKIRLWCSFLLNICIFTQSQLLSITFSSVSCTSAESLSLSPFCVVSSRWEHSIQWSCLPLTMLTTFSRSDWFTDTPSSCAVLLVTSTEFHSNKHNINFQGFQSFHLHSSLLNFSLVYRTHYLLFWNIWLFISPPTWVLYVQPHNWTMSL